MDPIIKAKIKAFYEISSLQKKLDDAYERSNGMSGVTFNADSGIFCACIDGKYIPFDPEEVNR